MALADLTPAYGDRATRVQRGVALVDRRYVLVQDELDARKADVWWFMHTPAAVTLEADGRSATLSQGGVKLLARLVSPAGVRFEVRPATPLPSSPNPKGQKANADVRKLAIHVAAAEHLRIVVALVPVDGKADAQWTPKIVPLAQW